MSMELIDYKFDNNEFNIKIYGTYNDPWFVGKEICELLGISKPKDFLKNLDNKYKQHPSILLDGWSQKRKVTLINEPALYWCILRCNKPEAKKFQEWVCMDVLPTLRRTGEYNMNKLKQDNEKLLHDKTQLSLQVAVLEESKQLCDRRIDTLEDQVDELNKRRFLVDPDEQKTTTIKDQIINLGIMTEDDINTLLCYETIIHNGQVRKCPHIKRSLFVSTLINISKCMASEVNRINGKKPEVRRKGRTNVYYIYEYEQFGNRIIRDYFTVNNILQELGLPDYVY